MWKYRLISAPRVRACGCAAFWLAAMFFGCLAGTARSEEQRVYTLAECLDLAARQNPDVLAAAKRLEAAKAQVTQARANIFPQLTANGFYQRREQSVATNGGNLPNFRPDDYSGDVRISQNLYSSGAVRNRIAAAELGARGEALTYQAAVNTVAASVRTAFYETLYSASLIGVRQQAVDLLGQQVKDQRDRLAAGSVAQINVNRAQVSLVNEEPALEEARYQLRVAYLQLAQLLAIPFADTAADIPFRIHGTLEVEPLQVSLDDCLRQADAARPEIAARKLAIDALKRQIEVEKAGTRPQVAAFAAYDIYSEQDLRSVGNNFSGYTVGLAASWQIFDGFLTLGKVRAARAQMGIAEATLASTRLQVQADVRTAYYGLRQALATLRPQADNIRLANENLDLTAKNFDAALTTQLEVLQSRVDLTRAQVTELSGREAYHVAMARLLRAVGGDRLVKRTGSDFLPAGGK